MKICDIYFACAALKKPAFAGIYALTEGLFTARLNLGATFNVRHGLFRQRSHNVPPSSFLVIFFHFFCFFHDKSLTDRVSCDRLILRGFAWGAENRKRAKKPGFLERRIQ
jgi:hypothetical protein